MYLGKYLLENKQKNALESTPRWRLDGVRRAIHQSCADLLMSSCRSTRHFYSKRLLADFAPARNGLTAWSTPWVLTPNSRPTPLLCSEHSSFCAS